MRRAPEARTYIQARLLASFFQRTLEVILEHKNSASPEVAGIPMFTDAQRRIMHLLGRRYRLIMR